MSDSIIIVDNLSKKYLISHKREHHYTALRDVIVSGAKDLGKKFLGKGETKVQKEEFWALKDISFEIKQGERVGIIGRNGAGKSTLLKLLSRITEPTTGKIHLKGRVASLLEVGTGFHPELTGRENVFLNGAIMGMSKSEIKKKFDEIVDFAEVEKFLDTPVKRYSSGMYVRLAFAVAAHLEPEILVVDEVLAVGDAEFQKKCLGKMEGVSEEGRTVLFVSHNMNAINQLCDKGLVLNDGAIIHTGEIQTAVSTYLKSSFRKTDGLALWDFNNSPGNDQLKLKSVAIVTDSKINSSPRADQDIFIEISFWNLEENSHRLISTHVVNSMGNTLFTPVNFKSASSSVDPWVNKKYPKGLFKTTCRIPSNILKPGCYFINLFINGTMDRDIILNLRQVVSFRVEESSEWMQDYMGDWDGMVRMKFDWHTEQIEE